MLVKIKEILTKLYFHMPPNFQCQLYYLHTTYRLHFWPNFGPPSKVSRQ